MDAKVFEKIQKRNKVMLSFMAKFYPNLFTENIKKIKPLGKNVFSMVRHDFIQKKLNPAKKYWEKYGYVFLRWYTNQTAYHVAVLRSKFRFGIDGKPCEKTVLEHKDYSLGKLVSLLVNLKGKNDPKLDNLIATISNACKKYTACKMHKNKKFNKKRHQKTTYKNYRYKKAV